MLPDGRLEFSDASVGQKGDIPKTDCLGVRDVFGSMRHVESVLGVSKRGATEKEALRLRMALYWGSQHSAFN